MLGDSKEELPLVTAHSPAHLTLYNTMLHFYLDNCRLSAAWKGEPTYSLHQERRGQLKEEEKWSFALEPTLQVAEKATCRQV